MAKRTYESQANPHGKATLAVKLDAHGEASYEHPTVGPEAFHSSFDDD